MFYAPLASRDVATLVEAAQNGDEAATQALLQGFQPLLRSRMHALWSSIRDGFSTLEWDDVEAQITFLFLSRLHTFQPEKGVYFPHYIERMLDLDARYWLRCQRRGAATPFSQLAPLDEGGEGFDEDAEWPFAGAVNAGFDEAPDIERTLALRAALDALPEAQRVLVWQCCVLGRTEASVGAELGISRSTVRNRLEAAIRTMRAFFSEADGAIGAAQNADSRPPTRTGRAPTQTTNNRVILARQQFWEGLILMAKDEKRPDLVGVGAGRPVLLQGTFDFPATGLKKPALLSKKLTYTVPQGHVLGVRYLRVGSVSDGMIAVSTVVNGMPHRIVPCASNATTHVSFAIVEPFVAGSQIEIHIASQFDGIAIIDVGCLQMPA